MGVTAKQTLGSDESTAITSGLDVRVLALASLSGIVGWVVVRAFGGSLLATLACAMIAPWITAFVTQPGRPRSLRVSAVLGFSGIVAIGRKAFGSKPREDDGKTPDPPTNPGPGEPTPDPVAASMQAWLSQVATTAAISIPPVIAAGVASNAIIPANAGPTVHVPDGIVVHAGDQRATRVTYRATAVDDAGAPIVPVCQPPSGALFTLGETRVECSATDADGKRAEEDFLVTVRPGGKPQPADHQRPRLSVPDDFTRNASEPRGARVTYPARARDARDGALTPNCRPRSGSFFALGRTSVACTATDASGNTTRARFTVTVIRAAAGAADQTPPDITVPDSIKREATSKAGARVRYTVSADDNRDGSLKPFCEPPSDSVFEVGTATVNCSAQDAAGNTAKESFTITVTRPTGGTDPTPPGRTVPDDTPGTPPQPDQTRPVITAPESISAYATGPDGATVDYSVSARDNRDGSLTPRCEPASGSVFKVGTTPVNCSAQDAAGNTATARFMVTILERPGPNAVPRTRIVEPQPQSNVQLKATLSPGGIYYADVTLTATARDPEGDPLTYSWTHSINRGPEELFSRRLSTIRRLRMPAPDGTAACSSEHILTLTVSDGGPPVKERVWVYLNREC